MKKICSLLLCLAMLFSVVAVNTGCTKKVDNIDHTKSQLWVCTRDSGLGYNWLESLAKAFEEKYANTVFEPDTDKVGVQVHVEKSYENKGDALVNSIANSKYSVHWVEAMWYADFMADDLLYDISEIVDDPLDDGSGTIQSKISAEQNSYLTGFDGNYYSLPWFSGFTGITYDATMFEKENFYFADANGIKPIIKSTYNDGKNYTGRGFTSATNKVKSPGPDGVKGSYDDGLPSTYEEFFALLDYINMKGLKGLIYTKASEHYLTYIFHALLAQAAGKEQLSYNFSFNSGNKTADIITDWDGDTPIVEPIKITTENGYLMSQLKGKYQALKFLECLFRNESKYFSSDNTGTGTEVQEIFLNSSFNSNYDDIAMLVEGNYWYNEAKVARSKWLKKYKERAKERDFRFMTLPAQEFGTVNEHAGSAPVVVDGLSTYLCINNNIKGDALKEELATKFVKFCFEDKSLQLTTTTSGMPVDAEYNLETAQFNEMDKYPQSCWEYFRASKSQGSYLAPVGPSKTYIGNRLTFGYYNASSYFTTKLDGLTYDSQRTVFTKKNGGAFKYDAKDYFMGMKMSQSDWTSLLKD